MIYRMLSAPNQPVRQAAASALSVTMLSVTMLSVTMLSVTMLSVTMLSAPGIFGGAARAQQPAAPPAAPAAPAAPKPAAPRPAVPPGSTQRAAPKPAATAPAAPAAAPQAQAPSSAPAAELPPLIYSPWTKFCGKGQDPGAKEVCFTGRDARTEAGQPVVAAALIENEGDPRKIFRVTLPNPLQLRYGIRIVIDQQPAITGEFFTCFSNGCMAENEASPDMIGKLKSGQMLSIQAINLSANVITFPLPLHDFKKAYEGPATDPKVFEEQQTKLQEELQKRADEARKRLEGQGAAAPATPTR